MHGRLRFMILVCLGLFLAGGVADAATLTFPGVSLVVPDNQEAEPGDLVTYCFILTNNTPGTASFKVSFRSNPDWPLLGETTTFTIASGQEEVIPLTVMVPPDAAAGAEHRLELLIDWAAGPIRAAVTTKIKPKTDFSLTAPQPVTAGPGMNVDLPFVLGNLGNMADTYHLEATSTKGWRLTPAKATLDLPANQVATAHFVLSVPLNTLDGTTEFVTVIARSLKTGRELAATVRVQVGQAIDGFGKVGEVNNQFIGEIGLSVNYPTALGDQSGIWLHLTGPLGSEERLELLLNGYFYLDPRLSISLFQYQTGNLRIRLGDLASPLTGLVSPGTGQAGFDLLYTTGSNKLQLTIGTPDGIGLVAEPVWYGLAWTRSSPQLEANLRWLKPDGLNDDGTGYLDSSLIWRTSNQKLTANLAFGLGGDSSAGSVGYWRQLDSLTWYARLAWNDEINQPNQLYEGNLFFSYRFDDFRQVSLTLNQIQQTTFTSLDGAIPSVEASLTRQLRLSLRLNPFLTTYATVEGIWRDESDWALADTDYRLGLTYTRPLAEVSSMLTVRSEFNRHEYLADGSSWSFLSAGGEYQFHLGETKGVWTAGLYGYASGNLGDGLDLDQFKIRLDRTVKEKNLTYRFTLSYTGYFQIPGIFSAEADLDWKITQDTRFSAGGSLSMNDFQLDLQLVHRFGLVTPRPHATIVGSVFQDLDDDNQQDADEPLLPGAWVTLDGRRVVRAGFDGKWTMAGVMPGVHQIGVQCDFDPSLRSKMGAVPIRVTAGGSVNLAVPIWRLTRISGRAFADREGDRVFDDGDFPLPTLVVKLTWPSGLEQTAAIAEDGTFSFPDLIPGTYVMRVIDGMAEDLVLPAPLTVIVAQQGLLVLDLPVRVKEKPILVTFAASPQLTATATPTTAARGESVRLTVKADMPLSRIEIQLPGQAPIGDPVDYLDSWSGEVAIPADQPLGPTVITVRAWDGGDTPGVAEVKVLVVKPSMSPRLGVTAAPSTVAPGGIITLKVTADMYLSRVEAKLDGLTPIASPANGLTWSGLLKVPADQPSGPLVITVRAWNGGAEPGIAQAQVLVARPLTIKTVVQPNPAPLAGTAAVELTASTPLTGAEIHYPGGEMSLTGGGIRWIGDVPLPMVFGLGQVVLVAQAHGADGSEATEQVVVRLEQNLPPDMRKVYPFDLGSAQLKAEFHPALLRLAEVLRANPSLKLFVIGHADQTGDPAFNGKLSMQRAKSVKRFLVESCGIQASRIEIQGKGQNEPVSSNATDEGRAFNRRVEFVLFPSFVSLQVALA